MADFQVWMLMHELVHFYSEQDLPPNYKEFYLVNECLRLSPTESVENPANYVYYAASKSPMNLETSYSRTWSFTQGFVCRYSVEL